MATQQQPKQEEQLPKQEEQQPKPADTLADRVLELVPDGNLFKVYFNGKLLYEYTAGGNNKRASVRISDLVGV